MKKDSRSLYSILSTILDCDSGRLIDAFDDVEADILDAAILNAREIYESLSLENIMQEVVDTVFEKIESDFYKERDLVLLNVEKSYGKGSREYELLNCLEVSDLRNSFTCEDGVIEWSDSYSAFSEEDIIVLEKHLPDSFKVLQESIGNIVNLPEIKKI